MRTLLRAAGAVLLMLVGLALVPAPTAAQDGDPAPPAIVTAPPPRPMIFVHGFLGSGQQFESQALRFASNGYPDELIHMFEHNSLAYPGSQEEVWERLDRTIGDALNDSGADGVYLLGHSQGTGVVQGYLNSHPDRASNVLRYVNLDGGAGGTVPDTVETLAIWGEGDPAREIPGATNVRFPDQAHTEVVNSPESFVEMFRFLAGREPQFEHVVRESPDEITVSGRVLLFPENAGAADAELNIWVVDPVTGRRLDAEPVAVYDLGEDGAFGPFQADGDAFYEFALVREERTHHVYVQRFVRSNPWFRVLTSEPGGLADSFWEVSEANSNLVVLRNKEWWGDQGAASDSLTIDETEVMNGAISPRASRIIGMFVHDEGLDGESQTEEPVDPSGLPFLTGVDLHLPASSPPDDTIAVVATPRLGDGPESVCVPNWPSVTDRMSIQLANYHHLLAPDGSPAEGHAAPDCAAPGDGPTPPAPPPPPGPPAPPAAPVPGAPTFTG